MKALKDYLRTTAGLVAAGRHDLLKIYLENIHKILSQPRHHPRLELVAVIQEKEQTDAG